MKVVRLSALGTGRLYPQEVFLILSTVKSRADRKDYINKKNSNNTTPPPLGCPGIEWLAGIVGSNPSGGMDVRVAFVV
jgi:hypothetical protein